MLSRRQVPPARFVSPVAGLSLVIALAVATLPGCASKHNSSGGGGGAPKELDSGDFAGGTTFAHTFANAGSYGYHCNIHGSMTGTVTVDASAPGMTADVTITTIAPFAAASVKPGGTVTWHNNSAMTHTVTSN
jgi:plastocyanin